MFSKPSPPLTEKDRAHHEHAILHRVGEVCVRKIEAKILDQDFRLKEDVLQDIRTQKADPAAAIGRARKGIEFIESIGPKAARDTSKLLKGELRQDNAELEYRDKRIFNLTVPEHLIPVLTANKCQRNICLFHKLIEHTNHVDKDLALNIGGGFPTIGPAPKTGLWPDREEERQKLDKWTNNAQNERVVKSVAEFYTMAITLKKHKPKLEDEVLDHIIQEIEEDIKRGRYKELSRDLLQVQPMLAFGVKQKNKIRLIIDERVKNSFSPLTEKLILKGTTYLVEAIRAFHAEPGMESNRTLLPASQKAKAAYKSVLEELNDWREHEKSEGGSTKGQTPSDIAAAIIKKNKGRLVENITSRGPAAFLRDFKKAYYQVGCMKPGENLIQAYDNLVKGWRYFEAISLTMGNTHSVTSWCRIAEAAEFFSRKVGGLIQFIYIDDSTTLAVNEDVAEIQMDFLDRLNAQLGLEISDKEEARQDSMSSDKMLILGLEYTFKSNETVIEVPQQKKDKIHALCEKLIADVNKGKVVHHDIQVLVGNLVYSLYSSGERSGNAVLHGIYPWFDPGFFERWIRNREKQRNLKRTLHFIMEITACMKPIRITGRNSVKEVVHLFTDASTDGGPTGQAGLGAALLKQDGTWLTTSAEVPSERIDILELKAVVLALETFNIENKEIVCHVDNAGDVYALIRGVHKTHRGSFTIHQILKLLLKGQNSVFWDYIKSEANIADFFTRKSKEAAGLAWTGTTLTKPAMSTLRKIDEVTTPIQLGDNLEKGVPVPGPWDTQSKKTAASSISRAEIQELEEENADWIIWNSHANKIADMLIGAEEEEVEPKAKRNRLAPA